MRNISYICNKCSSKKIEVMSVKEGVTEVDGKQIATVDVAYVCNNCLAVEIEKHFLYKLDTCVTRI